MVDDGGAASPDCTGPCAPLAPEGWTRDPVLLWTGAESDAPPCPASAPELFFRGYADLVASGTCDVCTCSDPACVLPTGLTASSSICPGTAPGSVKTDINAPLAWDGACMSSGTVPFSEARSMQIAAPTVAACTPGTVPVSAKLQPPTWSKYALTCQGVPRGLCEDPGSICAPALDAGFRLCVERTGLYAQPETDACPESYPERHVLYDGFEDQRSCTPCACDAPTGSDCSALVSTYSDASCSVPIGSLALSQDPGCLANVSGKGLASMSASWIANEPGSCKPTGGTLVGEIIPMQPLLFCCQP
jgi:hypothetical protein